MTLMQLQKTQEHCRKSLVKNPACLKTKIGSITDSILMTKNNRFLQTHSFETETSESHHLISTIFRTTNKNFQLGKFNTNLIRNFKNYSAFSLEEKFKSDSRFIQKGDDEFLQVTITEKFNNVRST